MSDATNTEIVDPEIAVLRAATHCRHEITADRVILYYDERQPGHNALNQLVRRLVALIDRPQPPYPFCCHPDKCIATGRCERRVGGELQCCAD